MYLCSQRYQSVLVHPQCDYAGLPGLDEPQSSGTSGLVAGVVVSVFVLVLAAACIVVLVVRLR